MSQTKGEEMKVELECICDEINSRHCQYHQDLADLRYEIDEKDKEIERLHKTLAELMPQADKLAYQLHNVISAHEDGMTVNWNVVHEALTEWQEYGGKE